MVLEAAYGWYWAADTLAELGAAVHLAHPLGVKMFSLRRVKNDQRDAADLADLLRMGRLPEAWIAPPATRELRGWVRHRAKLVGLRTCLKNQIHAVLAGAGVQVPMSDLFGPGGRQLLAATPLTVESRSRVDSLLRLIAALDFEIDLYARAGRRAAARRSRLPGHPADPRRRADPGRGVRRRDRRHHPLRSSRAVGLLGRADPETPRVRHHRAPRADHQTRLSAGALGRGRGRATRPGHTRLGQTRDRIGERRGRNIGVVAAARELITLVFYGLRDHHIRCLPAPAPTGAA